MSLAEASENIRSRVGVDGSIQALKAHRGLQVSIPPWVHVAIWYIFGP